MIIIPLDSEKCPTCKGKGEKDKKTCTTCGGKGFIVKTEGL